MRCTRSLSVGAFALAVALTGCAEATDDFNRTDVQFVQDMIPHHRQAMEMSEMAATRASSPEVKELAEQIEDDQKPEVRTMRGCLTDWKKTRPRHMQGMDRNGKDQGRSGSRMSNGAMGDLRGSSGSMFDHQFLQMMGAHHRSAIAMAKAEQKNGQNPDAVTLANDIERAQSDEITTINALLNR